jgi:putative ABC transport system permease protein
MGWLRRLRSTVLRPRQQLEIEEELRFHIEQRTEELIRDGMNADLARQHALRRFGNPALVRERTEDADRFGWLGDLVDDAKYGLRMMRRHPSFTVSALLTLALGIGATSTVFSVVYGVLLRPLPYPSAERLVRVWEEHPGGTTMGRERWISNRTYWAWSERPRTVDVLGAYGSFAATIRVGDDDVSTFGAQVSPALMPVLGVAPLAGRLFTAGEAEEGANRVVLLGEALWAEQFNRDSRIIGRTVRITGEPYTVIGVMPRRFRFPSVDEAFWRPYTIARVSTDPAQAQGTSGMTAMARLAPGVTAAQVEAEGTAMARSVPVTMATKGLFGVGGPPVVHVRPLAADMTGRVRPVLLVLAAAVGALLLIACANVANMFLTRGLARQREFAVRASVGAGRGRLVRQLLTETFVLSVGGAILGLFLAWLLLRVTPLVAPARFPRLADVYLDRQVLAFTAGATLVTTLLCGLLPALRGARFNVAASLRGGNGATAEGFHGPRDRRLRDVLLVAESAFALMLLVAAMLLVRSFVSLTGVDPGYSAERVVTAHVMMPPESGPDRSDRFVGGALSRLRGLAGVASAGAGNMMPMFQRQAVVTFPLPDPSGVSPEITARATSYMVTPGYIEALGVRLRAGRSFDERDVQSGMRAILVNELFARRYLGPGPIVGRRFTDLFRRTDRGVVTEIVGVVAPMLKDGNDSEPQPEVYFVAKQRNALGQSVSFVVRTTGDPRALVAPVRGVLRDLDPDVIIDSVQPLADALAASVAQPRFATATVMTFALLALILASIGLYGVLSYAVSQRGRELGVRAALGASRSSLLGLVLREGLAVAICGVVLGIGGAAAISRLMQGALFGVTPLDPVSFAMAPVVLLPVAFAACLAPALRASRVGPAEALRE